MHNVAHVMGMTELRNVYLPGRFKGSMSQGFAFSILGEPSKFSKPFHSANYTRSYVLLWRRLVWNAHSWWLPMAGMTVAKLADQEDLLLRDVARVLGEYSRVVFFDRSI